MSTSASVRVAEVATGRLREGAVRAPGWSLAAALLGFFVVTLDAVILNVALPDNRRELASGMSGLQRVVDGYTLMFAALLLSAGSLTDRIGARRAFGTGMVVFVLASAAMALAGFGALQARGRHPMVPLELFRSRTVCLAVAVGSRSWSATTGFRS